MGFWSLRTECTKPVKPNISSRDAKSEEIYKDSPSDLPRDSIFVVRVPLPDEPNNLRISYEYGPGSPMCHKDQLGVLTL